MNAKTKSIVIRVLTALLAILFLIFGVSKLMGLEMMVNNFIRWGYPSWFLYVVGGLEVLGAIGLMLPQFRRYAAMGLIALMLGAIFTHIKAGEMSQVINPLIHALIAGLIIYWDKPN